MKYVLINVTLFALTINKQINAVYLIKAHTLSFVYCSESTEATLGGK